MMTTAALCDVHPSVRVLSAVTASTGKTELNMFAVGDDREASTAFLVSRIDGRHYVMGSKRFGVDESMRAYIKPDTEGRIPTTGPVPPSARS